jgi:hypothetical protein
VHIPQSSRAGHSLQSRADLQPDALSAAFVVSAGQQIPPPPVYSDASIGDAEHPGALPETAYACSFRSVQDEPTGYFTAVSATSTLTLAVPK